MNKAEMLIIKGILDKTRRINHILWGQTLDRQKMDNHKTISDLLKSAEKLVEAINKGTCQSCPAMKKVDNLADAIDQAVLISKETGTPFEIHITEPDVERFSKIAEDAVRRMATYHGGFVDGKKGDNS